MKISDLDDETSIALIKRLLLLNKSEMKCINAPMMPIDLVTIGAKAGYYDKIDNVFVFGEIIEIKEINADGGVAVLIFWENDHIFDTTNIYFCFNKCKTLQKYYDSLTNDNKLSIKDHSFKFVEEISFLNKNDERIIISKKEILNEK